MWVGLKAYGNKDGKSGSAQALLITPHMVCARQGTQSLFKARFFFCGNGLPRSNPRGGKRASMNALCAQWNSGPWLPPVQSSDLRIWTSNCLLPIFKWYLPGISDYHVKTGLSFHTQKVLLNLSTIGLIALSFLPTPHLWYPVHQPVQATALNLYCSFHLFCLHFYSNHCSPWPLRLHLVLSLCSPLIYHTHSLYDYHSALL